MKKPALYLLLLVAACQPRPARFADAPPVLVVGDDAPIQVPRAFEPVPEVRMSEAYLRRPVVNALDAARVPPAGDVNALDEVPRSSWFAPGAPAEDHAPPVLPLHPVAAPATTREGAMRVVDARGRFFEIWRDPPDRPEMSTGAAAAASRIVRELGWRVPTVSVIDLAAEELDARGPEDQAAKKALLSAGPPAVRGRFRVGVVRWPLGIELGPTHPFDVRQGDANDRVAHLDRRTMRALGVVLEWLGVNRFGSGLLRDAYVGAPGKGHVRHYVVDLAGAFGADAVVRPEAPRDDDADLVGRNVWVTLGTAGLYTPPPAATQRRFPAIGDYGPLLSRQRFHTAPPFEPVDRLLPGDAYWVAKRMAALPPAKVAEALAAGLVSDPAARARLAEIVQKRRLALVARAFAGVTAVEVEDVSAGAVVLRDEAIRRGFAVAATTRYELEIEGDDGARLAGPATLAAASARFVVTLPASLPPYAVLRVTAARDGRAAPRALEVHVVRRASGWAVVGVRH